MSHYRELIAWRVAHELAVEVYRVSSGWPRDERFGLTAQLRRAAFSIPANLAEGSMRRGVREFRRFADIAPGSFGELEYGIGFAEAVGVASSADRQRLDPMVRRVGQLCYRLARRLGESS